MTTKTPDSFYAAYNGKVIDYDHYAGAQCVDAFKIGCAYLGIPVVACPNNWAESYWTCLDKDGRPSEPTAQWQEKYFDRVKDPGRFINGDWVIWPRGSKSHNSSHVALYYQGKEFSENQGGNGGFCLKETDFSDAFGALRPKAWGHFDEYEQDLTINGREYRLYGQSNTLKPIVLSPGLNKTAGIREMDKDDEKNEQTAAVKFDNGDWAVAVFPGKICPRDTVTFFDHFTGVQELILMDSGGSSQMLAWNNSKKAMEKKIYTKRKLPNVLIIAKIEKTEKEPVAEDLEPVEEPIIIPEVPEEPEVQPEEPEKEEEKEMSEVVKDSDWKDPEPKTNVIVERIAALLSVKSLLTLALTVVFAYLVMNQISIPDFFTDIYKRLFSTKLLMDVDNATSQIK